MTGGTALELLIGGVLLGGIYALLASGLNLIFGVMRVVNFARSDVIALGALLTITLVSGLALPDWAAALLVPLAGLLGYVIQAAVIRRVVEGPMIIALLASDGISSVLVNAAILIWGGRLQGLPGVLGGALDFDGVHVSLSRFVARVVALAVSSGVGGCCKRRRSAGPSGPFRRRQGSRPFSASPSTGCGTPPSR